MAVTKEGIFKAADELKASGESPTLAAIRKKVGGGSFTTISEAMKEWRESTAPKAPVKTPAPESLKGRLDELSAELWDAALTMANDRLASERAALAMARSELEVASAEAAELADQLAGELDQEREKAAAAKRMSSDLLADLQNRLDAALLGESRASALASEMAAKIEEMAARIDDAKQAAARDAKAHADEVARHEATRGKLSASETALAARAADLKVAQEGLSDAMEDMASMRKQSTETASQLAVAIANAAHARELASERTAELERLRSHSADLATSLKALAASAAPAPQKRGKSGGNQDQVG